ncbi:MAG: response regulator [Oligoflexales bacterium]
MKESKSIVLIVDDNLKNIQIAGNIIKREIDCNLSFATCGEEAITKAKKIKPDVILLDIMMPGLDGYKTCKILKDCPGFSEVPIIFLSAKSDEEDVIKGFGVGACDYVTKPFRGAELIARVKTHLALKKKSELLHLANLEQREIIHILCHDLINVLFPIKQVLPVLSSKNCSKKYREKCMQLIDNGLSIIGLVRKMSVLDEGKLELAKVSIKQAIFDALLIVEEKLAQKDLHVELKVEKELFVFAEPVSLVNSVLLNLLTNAIKYSHPGEAICISVYDYEKSIILTVKDNGVGISADILPNIFDFRRSFSMPGTKGEKGTGFGLPLVKKFVDKYGAEIAVKSNISSKTTTNNGTEVSIQFPIV